MVNTTADAADEPVDVETLAAHVRSHAALQAKAEIGIVSEVLGPRSWVHGPGDDGAVVDLGTGAGDDTTGHVVACGEALLPAFVALDPYGAGFAAVLANVNDLAAMGARPHGIVDTIVGSADLAREALRGMQAASLVYDVPLIGGHLTVHDGTPALSAFGIGHADAVLTVTRVAVGQSLIAASCTRGTMRADFPFFRSFEERGSELAGDVRLLAEIARSGACVAAKDVSMAGAVGSLAMLLEWSRLGVRLDLDRLPRPSGVSMAAWLTCFPAFSFLMCSPPGREDECADAFRSRGLEAAVVGTIDDTGLLSLALHGQQAVVLDMAAGGVTRLRR
ncbi:MAG TPA: AIR synthase related protein [Jiangellaceae bacterium]|nr:AIR synthase related protein [Jiangellaceae bacterium]